jgi:hypothetical protein
LLSTPNFIFGGVFIIPRDMVEFLRWMYYGSYFKHAIDGSVKAVLDNRDLLPCEKIFCPFQNTTKLFQLIDMPEESQYPFIAIPLICLTLHLTAYLNMKRKLKTSTMMN